ncbi:MAG: hypothetical protein B9J98_03470 [Candidatus Terraquivivens tikiterensis]|uniref:Uncharacterized protein n=1 Tax=Candidatus Terraquivivens tikiterensis TaxID=1980982 RepID=A0A2R7Y5Z0_9ARCH|nr:MAG: hypothetical protein B9J98_03470 [Candidatus Terraquivivens tikiterensis]
MTKTRKSRPRAIDAEKSGVEAKLQEVLRELQQKTRLGYELEKVVWLPGRKVLNPEGRPLAAEVKGNTVFVYDEHDPVFTLKHEFFEFLLNQDKMPLLDLLARLLAQIVYEQYKRSERLADVLAKHF